MKTLYQALDAYPGIGPVVAGHLNESGIHDWADLTRVNLADYRDALTKRVAPSSAKTYMAILGAVIARYEDAVEIPCKDYRKYIKVKGDKPVKIFLTKEELKRLERVYTETPIEKFVQLSFLVEAYTGMRVSDCMEVSKENITNGFLTYTSIKTKIQATVPCCKRVVEYIEQLRRYDFRPCITTYETTIRKLCQRAGLTERVKIHKAGRDEVRPKWECVTSHTARVSAATNLAIAGVPLCDIKQILGHTSEAMSSRYIAQHEVKLNERAMAYFR